MQEGMIGPRAAERAHQHELTCATGKGGIYGDLAVGLVLLRREDFDRYPSMRGAHVLVDGIEIAGPQFRRHAERVGVADAGIGGDHPRTVELAHEPGGRDKVAPEEDGKAGHGPPLSRRAANAKAPRAWAVVDGGARRCPPLSCRTSPP